MYINIYVYIYTYIFMYIYIYIYIHLYIHICIYIHMHTVFTYTGVGLDKYIYVFTYTGVGVDQCILDVRPGQPQRGVCLSGAPTSSRLGPSSHLEFILTSTRTATPSEGVCQGSEYGPFGPNVRIGGSYQGVLDAHPGPRQRGVCMSGTPTSSRRALSGKPLGGLRLFHQKSRD